MDFARATVEAAERERHEAKKRKRSEAEEAQVRAEEPAAAAGIGAGEVRPQPGRGVPPPQSAREAKARREARRRLEGGADATEEVALARAEERGAEGLGHGSGGVGPAAAAAGARPGFTAFNMDEEKEEGGGFDRGGFYRADRLDAEEAWLAQADVVGGEVAQRHAERQAAGAAADSAPLSEVEVAELKRRLGKLLRERETVAQALKRCASGAGGKRGPMGKRQRALLERRQKAAGAAAHGGGGARGGVGSRDPAALEAITECASALLQSGEHDVYAQMRRQLLREAEIVLGPSRSGPEAPPGAAAVGDGAPTAAAAAGDEDDMFAED